MRSSVSVFSSKKSRTPGRYSKLRAHSEIYLKSSFWKIEILVKYEDSRSGTIRHVFVRMIHELNSIRDRWDNRKSIILLKRLHAFYRHWLWYNFTAHSVLWRSLPTGVHQKTRSSHSSSINRSALSSYSNSSFILVQSSYLYVLA